MTEQLRSAIAHKRLGPAYLCIARDLTVLSDALRTFALHNVGGSADWAENHPDIWCFAPESDTAIKLDVVHSLIAFAQKTSLSGQKRFILLNAVERLNRNAANALLKTLEEPPENVHFLLTTERLSQVLPTIRSRCQLMPVRDGDAAGLQETEQSLAEWRGDAATLHTMLGRLGARNTLALLDTQIVERCIRYCQADYTQKSDSIAQCFAVHDEVTRLCAMLDAGFTPNPQILAGTLAEYYRRLERET